MTQPQPKVRDLHDTARKALDELRGYLNETLNEIDARPFYEAADRAEAAIDEADAFLHRLVADIADVTARVGAE